MQETTCSVLFCLLVSHHQKASNKWNSFLLRSSPVSHIRTLVSPHPGVLDAPWASPELHSSPESLSLGANHKFGSSDLPVFFYFRTACWRWHCLNTDCSTNISSRRNKSFRAILLLLLHASFPFSNDKFLWYSEVIFKMHFMHFLICSTS